MNDKPLLGNIHSSGQLLLVVAVALVAGMIVIFLGSLLILPFISAGLSELMGGLDLSHDGHLQVMKYFQIISHLGLFIVPSVILAWLFGNNISQYLFLARMPQGRVLLVSALLIFAAVPLINYILELNMSMHFPEALEPLEDWMRRQEDNAQRTTEAFLAVDNLSGLLFNIFMIALIPAIGEEFMFRGVLLRIFTRWAASAHLAVWITAIIFSAIHFQFFGFFPRMLLGVMFGYLVIWTGSLWPAMIAHFVNNAAAVTFFYLFQHRISDGTLENLGKGTGGMIYASISLLVTVAVLLWVRRETHTSGNKNPGQVTRGL